MASQYVQDSTGTYIPATQRPDGSWRKARRVKDGYVPPEEMPLYESKGKQWAKSKPTFPIGLDPCYLVKEDKTNETSVKSIPGLDQQCIVSANKSSKKKKKKSALKICDGIEHLNICEETLPNMSVNESPTSKDLEKESTPIDITKRVRNLRKKLKEINALQSKIDSGQLPNPEKDQLDKLARRDEIESEIEELMYC